jgi:WD40 repeat protein
LEFCDATTLVSASNDGTTRFWDVESGEEKGQDAPGAHGEALAGERFAFATKSSTDSKDKKFYRFNSKDKTFYRFKVVGRFIVTAKDALVCVYEVDEGVADKGEKKTTVAFFAAPSVIQSLACAGDKIAVGLQNGGVLHLRAAFLVAGG